MVIAKILSIDPLTDARWNAFLEFHPRSSVFHTTAWLRALKETYGYQPFALATTDQDGGLRSAVVCCSVKSWVTGRRLVSLPFSDHCEPLVGSSGDLGEICQSLVTEVDAEKWRYIEMRPLNPVATDIGRLSTSSIYAFHQLDLSSSKDDLYSQLHKSCIQRKITRAQKEGITSVAGRSDEMLNEFYSLMVQTRRRFHLLPQPRSWFANLRDSFGDKLTIRIAYKSRMAIAAILTLQHKSSLVYKYGCSNAKLHRLGAMPYLFWDAIADAKNHDLRTFDLGRSDLNGVGLIAFKEHLGATRTDLAYMRYPASVPTSSPRAKGFRKTVTRLPDLCLSMAGRLLYRHIG